MPYIHAHTNQHWMDAQAAQLKCDLGEAIALLPGKSEQWLMLELSRGCDMAFRGESGAPVAFFEVKVYGKPNAQAFDVLTARLTQLAQGLGVAPDHTYVQYEACEHWGWNGGNF